MKNVILILCIVLSVSAINAQEMTTNRPDKSNISRDAIKNQPLEENNTANQPSQNAEVTGENNVMGVNEETASPSGSPAVTTSDDSNTVDGTNTAQRATLNIAGSPIPKTSGRVLNNNNKNVDQRRNQSEDVQGKGKNDAASDTENVRREIDSKVNNKTAKKKNKRS